MSTDSPTTTLQAPLRGFQFKHGDRPLDGYTIERAAGRGGFGEVYYAISDGGRELALKVVNTYEQIELRGIAQCMNLKSPHLVTIFDVKYGADGRPWVVMEYVAGPSLRELLDASPSGLGTQKAAFFLREIGKGLTYLHECGIVHRDLKPGNIFFENGYVKIGDYGLSKAISPGGHTGQTVTVGTVHYMAPEIGQGRYDKSIDIYAMGVLLYEMLTGQVPFFGASPAEILMKHLGTQVDLRNIEEPFASVIAKAMAKNPADRYASVQEMVEAVFGAEHVRNSVSHFSPDSLTMVAGYAARNVGPASGSFTPSDTPPAGNGLFDLRDRCGRWGAGRLGRFADRFIPLPSPEADDAPGRVAPDPIPAPHRRVLACIALLIVALAAGLIGGSDTINPPQYVMFVLLAAAGATIGVILGRDRLWPVVQGESRLFQRLAIGGTGVFTSAILTAPLWIDGRGIGDEFRHTLGAIAVCLLVLDWRARRSRRRPYRIGLAHLLRAAALGAFLGLLFGGNAVLAIGVVAGTSLAVEVVSAWDRAAGERVRAARPRRFAGFATGKGPYEAAARREVASPLAPVTPPAMGSAPATPAGASATSEAQGSARSMFRDSSTPAIPSRPPRTVGRFARVVWLVLFVSCATLGLFLWCLLLVGQDTDPNDRSLQLGIGAASLLAAWFCLRRVKDATFTGWWSYLVRPLIVMVCVVSIIMSFSYLWVGNVHGNDAVPAMFFLICPMVILITMHNLVPRALATRDLQSTESAMSTSSIAGMRMSRNAMSMSMGSMAGESPLRLIAALGRFTLAVLGWAFLAIALLAALAVAVDVPGFFAGPWIDPQVRNDAQRALGTPQWPLLLRDGGAILSFVLAIPALVLFLLSRRGRGTPHMLRAMLGVGALFGAVALLGHHLPAWNQIAAGPNPAEIASQFLSQVPRWPALRAAALAVAGLVLLIWPVASSKAPAFASGGPATATEVK